MAAHDANTFEKTHYLNAPQVEYKTEAEGRGLFLCLINRILTRVPGENHEESGSSTDKLWKKHLEEIEKQDDEMVERWKGEADTTIIFVCTGPTILSVSSF